MTDRLIPSVEDAASRLSACLIVRQIFAETCNCGTAACAGCLQDFFDIENAALALDMALAQASDARRAEDDRLRSEVAW